MLVEIECAGFAAAHRRIAFNAGLNTVLGSNNGSNAIGKSTFLWIIDFAFGGETYQKIWKGSLQHVGSDPVFFTFQFENTLHYFYRTLEEHRAVFRCNKKGRPIDKQPLVAFRNWLKDCSGAECPGVSFRDLSNRFGRIYGADNASERAPYLQRPRETEEKAVDFLLRLAGGNELLEKIEAAEEKLGVRVSELGIKNQKPADWSGKTKTR